MDIGCIIAAKKFGKGGSGGSSGPVSWNDLTDKPFYEETAMAQMEVMPETSVDGSYDEFYNGAHPLMFTSGYFNYGEAVTVVFNGVEYPLNYSGFKANSETEGLACYGNGYLISDSLPDTGEPFVFTDSIWDGTYSGPSAGDNIGLYNGYASAVGIYTIRIYKYAEQTTVKTLDEKFVPETVATKEYADSVFPVVLFTMGTNGDGETVVKYWDGNAHTSSFAIMSLHDAESGISYRYPMSYSYYEWDAPHFVFIDKDGGKHTIKCDWETGEPTEYTYTAAT